ncbi:MAG TPA: metallophosphoesterase [Turneriella sp.]|nr:metallophosphoesterase [Turneriella sp.]
MQIVYLTDIHDNFAGVSSVLNSTEADLYILSGDLTYHCFGTDDALFRFIELQDKIRTLALKAGAAVSDIHATNRFAEKAKQGEIPTLLSAREGEEYLTLAQEAHQELLRKYQTMHKAIVATRKKCFIIPGNYDIELSATAVSSYNIHKKSEIVDSFKFAGYGSAPIFTPGIPQELTVPFEESDVGTTLKSQPMDFMLAEKADVFILHNPPYGTLDKLARYGHCGSQGLREAVDKVNPRLVLSGHVHESYGLLKLGSTYFLNPSNFGSVESVDGPQFGGYFATLQLQHDETGQKYLREVVWKRLVDRRIHELCRVKIDKNQRAAETVIDQAEFQKMERFLL